MFTFLDLLVVVFMGLIVASLLAICLMFLAKKPRLKKVCFFIVAALGVYLGTVGIRIGSGFFPVQTAVGFLIMIPIAIAVVLNLRSKSSKKKFNISCLIAAGSLVIALLNAIF